MLVIKANNVNDALPEACRKLLACKVERDSRNGKVWMFPEPVTTVYRHPAHRVLFDPDRDANPFFHLMECVWMIGGRDDLETIGRYTSGLAQFSDDGEKLRGAYGHRWRFHFNHDQIRRVVLGLEKNPDCRRQVIAMYDPVDDGCAVEGAKDIPCNTQIYFSVNEHGNVEITVCNRSNDLVWGCYGANAVHFAFLQEVVAALLKRRIGRYRQVSNNLHVYERHFELVEKLAAKASDPPSAGPGDPYANGTAAKIMGTEDADALLGEAAAWIERPHPEARSEFLRTVAYPVAGAYAAFKLLGPPERFGKAREAVAACAAPDWRRACEEWLGRREERWTSSSAGA